MIDDNVRHFERFWGEGILYTAPHNVNETRFRRVDSWDDVRAMFLGAANLKRQNRDPNHASRLA